MTTEQKTIKRKVAMVELAEQLGNVSNACQLAETASIGSKSSNPAGADSEASGVDRAGAGQCPKGDGSARVGQVRVADALRKQAIGCCRSSKSMRSR